MVTWSQEKWAQDRNLFVFRTLSHPSGGRWTFCISARTLEDLCPDEHLEPDECFSRYRGAIYRAAERHAGSDDPSRQIDLSASEVRAAL